MAGQQRVVHVMLPTGSKVETGMARRALERDDVLLVMCTSAGHTPGQVLYGDVVVVGTMPATIEQDTSGKVYHVEDMAGLEGLDTTLVRRARAMARAEDAAEDEKAAAASAPEGPAEEAPAPVAALPSEDEPDELAGMSRVEMIQHAAARWPGQRRWATLSNDDLAAAIKDLEADD